MPRYPHKLMDENIHDEQHMQAAEGWLDLDEAVEAEKELEKLSPKGRSHSLTLLLRCRIYLATHRADAAHIIASRMAEQAPQVPDGWFYLACACARLSQNDEAGVALKKCFEAAAKRGREKEWKEKALDERDLDGYWAENSKH